MNARVRNLMMAVSLLAASAFSQSTGSLQGVVFTRGSDGGRAVVPAAKVSLRGIVTRETATGANGKFAFSAVPAGSYILEAHAPRLIASQTKEIGSGKSGDVALEMTVESVSESISVTASASTSGTQESAAASTVGELAVKAVPNINERFDSLLPLVPGVVRGPDGRVDMKGAR